MLDVKYANHLHIFFKDVDMEFIVTFGQGHVFIPFTASMIREKSNVLNL